VEFQVIVLEVSVAQVALCEVRCLERGDEAEVHIYTSVSDVDDDIVASVSPCWPRHARKGLIESCWDVE